MDTLTQPQAVDPPKKDSLGKTTAPAPAGNTPSDDYRGYRFWRRIMRWLGRIRFARTVRSHQNTRILVILHLFYMSSWVEIKEYLKNLDAYSYDLIVTYTDAQIDESVLADIKAYKPGVRLIECENLGFDVIPFLDVLKQVDQSAYDIIFKLQSNGVHREQIYIYGQFFKRRDWFLNLYNGCIGPFTVHKTIDVLTDPRRKTGIVAAKNLILPDPPHKQHMVIDYMQKNGLEIPEPYLFVAGTCFGERAEVAALQKALPYDKEEIRSAGKRNFSVAHRLERIICLENILAGFDFYGNPVMRARRFFLSLTPEARRRKKYSPERVWLDPRFRLNDEFIYFSLEMKQVEDYELIRLPLKDIRRRWRNKFYRLQDCTPYKYLVTRDRALYEKYSRQNKALYNLSMMSLDRFEELIHSLETTGYDEKDVVVVKADNSLMDGQHRCCYLLYRFGEDYTIPVLRIHFYTPKPKKPLGKRITGYFKKLIPIPVKRTIKSLFRFIKRAF